MREFGITGIFALLVFLGLASNSMQKCQREKAQVIFASDVSEAMPWVPFTRGRCQLLRAVKGLVGDSNVEVSVLSYASDVKEDITSNNKTKMTQAIRNLEHYEKERPDLLNVLKSMENRLSADKIKKFFFFFTSGQHLNQTETEDMITNKARKLRQDNGHDVQMYTVTPEDRDKSKASYVHQLTGYNENKFHLGHDINLVGIVERKLVKRCSDCYQSKVDFVFLLDNSRSMESEQLVAKTFMKDMVDYFTMGKDDVRYAVVTYGTKVHKHMTSGFTEHMDKARFKGVIDRIAPLPTKEQSNTGEAADYVGESILVKAREDARIIVIHLTDRENDVNMDRYKTKWQALEDNHNAQTYRIRFDHTNNVLKDKNVYIGTDMRKFGDVNDKMEYFCMQGAHTKFYHPIY